MWWMKGQWRSEPNSWTTSHLSGPRDLSKGAKTRPTAGAWGGGAEAQAGTRATAFGRGLISRSGSVRRAAEAAEHMQRAQQQGARGSHRVRAEGARGVRRREGRGQDGHGRGMPSRVRDPRDIWSIATSLLPNPGPTLGTLSLPGSRDRSPNRASEEGTGKGHKG